MLRDGRDHVPAVGGRLGAHYLDNGRAGAGGTNCRFYRTGNVETVLGGPECSSQVRTSKTCKVCHNVCLCLSDGVARFDPGVAPCMLGVSPHTRGILRACAMHRNRDHVPAAGGSHGGRLPNQINNKILYLTVHCPCQDDPDVDPNKTCRNGITKMLEADMSLDDLTKELMGRVGQHVADHHGHHWESAAQLVENFSHVTEYWEEDVEKRDRCNRSRSPVPERRRLARSTAASSTTTPQSTTPQPTTRADNLFAWTTIQGTAQAVDLRQMSLLTLEELGRAANAEMESRLCN